VKQSLPKAASNVLTRTPPQKILKPIRRRRSPIAGWGVYALAPITKNSRIVDYAGQIISWKESERREERYIAKGCIWCFVLKSRHTVVDANVGGNIARFINHACKSNCYTQVVNGVIWIKASRNIRKGEELTYDYETGGGGGISCRCRPNCKTKL
jgi:SET domain-containing protein